MSTRESFCQEPPWRYVEREITPMSQEQTVSEMVERVLLRQARKLADRTGMPLEVALQAVAATEAGAQLRELAEGEHRHEQARHWQAHLRFERASVRVRQ